MPATDIWSAISPFVAAGTAVFLARRQDRERISCFVGWGYSWDEDHGYPHDWAYIGIHNQSPHTIAVRSIRLLTGSFPRKTIEGTCVNYEDPTDLDFPYKVESGQLRTIPLDEMLVRRTVKEAWTISSFANIALRRPRVVVKCVSTAGTTLTTSAEEALPWQDRQRWARA